MTLRPSLAARSRSASAALDGLGVALRRARPSGARPARLRSPGSTTMIAPSPADSGEGSVSVQLLTPTTICSPLSIAAEALGVALDQARASCSRWRRPRRPSPRCARARPAACVLQLVDLARRSPRSRRRCRRIRADRSRRPGSAACAATTAGPTGAAGRAPRSRPEAARRGRARSSTA